MHMASFPYFYGKKYENATYFLDDLEMALLDSRRDENKVKLRVFLFGPAALREVLNAPHPVIVPFMMYENLFDVYVYILL